MAGVIIGVDPHKLSATIEVVDHHGGLLGSGRFTTDKAGYAAMRSYVSTWPRDAARHAVNRGTYVTPQNLAVGEWLDRRP